MNRICRELIEFLKKKFDQGSGEQRLRRVGSLFTALKPIDSIVMVKRPSMDS